MLGDDDLEMMTCAVHAVWVSLVLVFHFCLLLFTYTCQTYTSKHGVLRLRSCCRVSPATQSRIMATDDIPFQTLVNVFEICKNAPKSRAKAALRKFLYTGLDRRRTDLFIVIRLMLPKHDNQRGNYKLKEAKLIDAVLKALSIDQKRGNLAAFVRQWKSESGYRGNKLANVLMQVCNNAQ